MLEMRKSESKEIQMEKLIIIDFLNLDVQTKEQQLIKDQL